jgi:quercetin dioxygenase-like cupin family protein
MRADARGGAAATLVRSREVDWDDMREGRGPQPPAELVEQARRSGARRKRLLRGEGGFFLNRSSLPAGFRIPAHEHDHDELLVVLSGGCRLDCELGELGPDDAVAIRAGTRYGFTCGALGMEFLTIRTGEASVAIVE